MQRPSNNQLLLALALAALIGAPGPLLAQEGDEGGVEINLDALESLSPARDEAPVGDPPPTETDPETPGDDDLLLPPGMEDTQSKGPPELTPPPEPILTQPDPQTPVAPRATDLTEEPETTPVALAARLKGRIDHLLFETGENTLSLSAAEQLDAIAGEIEGTAVRLELHAFGGDKKQSISEAKRLSLNRAIAVRGYLMDRGIDGTRIALRPKGLAEKKTAPDRVDIHFLTP